MLSRYTLLLALPLLLTLTACEPVEFETNRGDSGQFSDFHGQWLVINYWATWCKPCIEEIPELNQLAIDHRDSIAVLGVNFDNQQGEKLTASIAKLGIAFPVLLRDPAPTLAFQRPSVLPTTVLIAPSGELHTVLVGPQTGETLREAMAGGQQL